MAEQRGGSFRNILHSVIGSAVYQAIAGSLVLAALAVWWRGQTDFVQAVFYTLAAVLAGAALVLCIKGYFADRKKTASILSPLAPPPESAQPIASPPIPLLPHGFSIRAQELRGGSSPLAPHVLRVELQIATSVRGHILRFFCDGPIYREACRFQQSGLDLGTVETGATTNSVALRIGPRAFAEPGILVAELSSIAPLKLRRIEDEPDFSQAPPMPGSRGGAEISGSNAQAASHEQERLRVVLRGLDSVQTKFLRSLLAGPQSINPQDVLGSQSETHSFLGLLGTGLIENIGQGAQWLSPIYRLRPSSADSVRSFLESLQDGTVTKLATAGAASVPAYSTTSLPILDVQFRQDGYNSYYCLTVHNTGAPALEVYGLIFIANPLPNWPSGDVYVKWEGTDVSRVPLPTGSTRRIDIARTKREEGDAHFVIYFSRDGKAGEVLGPTYSRQQLASHTYLLEVHVTVMAMPPINPITKKFEIKT